MKNTNHSPDNGYFDLHDNPLIRVYMNERLKRHKTYSKALDQLALAAYLPGVVSPIVGMPDLTYAYGLPVGGILATDAENGVVSLNAIGGDIGCGISLSQTTIPISTFLDGHLVKSANCEAFAANIEKQLSGKNNGHDYGLVLERGAAGIVSGNESAKIEQYGSLIASTKMIENELIEKAKLHLGTLGGGNHFIDLLNCEEIFDEELAILWGITPGNVLSMVHTGSRGIGSYLQAKFSNPSMYDSWHGKIFQPRPARSKEGNEILNAVNMATNFAFANRAELRMIIGTALEETYGADIRQDLIYDFAHNFISVEPGKESEIVLHRKGASRGLPAGHLLNTSYYMDTGHPIIIPGSLGTATYILVGTPELEKAHYSTNHGAGRKYPRGYVRKKMDHPRFKEGFANIFINRRYRDVCEESPAAYKSIEDVVDTLIMNGFVRKVARLKPFFVYVEKD